MTGIAQPYVRVGVQVQVRMLSLYPEGIDHDVLLVESGDSARKVIGNESTRLDLQTGKSLVEDR